MPPDEVPNTKWLRRAVLIGGAGALLHALSAAGALVLFYVGCSCSCPPVTNVIAWLATVLTASPLTVAAVFASSAFTSENPFSLKNHWLPAVIATVGFLIAGGGVIGASMKLTGHIPPQAAGLVCGAALLALAPPVALNGRFRLGAALGAVGAAVIGLSGLFPITSDPTIFGARITWETLVAAVLQLSIIGHPLVMLSISAVLALLVIGVPKRVVTAAAAAPTAILVALSFRFAGVLAAWITEYYSHMSSYFDTVPGPFTVSLIVIASLLLVGPVLLGSGGIIATAAITLKLVRAEAEE